MTNSTKLSKLIMFFKRDLALDILIGLFWILSIIVSIFRAISTGVNFKVVLVIISTILILVSSLLFFAEYQYATGLFLVGLLGFLFGVWSVVFKATKLLVGIGLLFIRN